MSSNKVQEHSCSKRGKNQNHEFLSQRSYLLLLFTQPVCISIPCSCLGKNPHALSEAVLKTQVGGSLGHLLLLELSDIQLKGIVISLELQPKQPKEGGAGELESRRIPNRNREVGTDMGWQRSTSECTETAEVIKLKKKVSYIMLQVPPVCVRIVFSKDYFVFTEDVFLLLTLSLLFSPLVLLEFSMRG